MDKKFKGKLRLLALMKLYIVIICSSFFAINVQSVNAATYCSTVGAPFYWIDMGHTAYIKYNNVEYIVSPDTTSYRLPSGVLLTRLGKSSIGTAVWCFTDSPPNTAPVIPATGSLTLDEDTTASHTVVITDPDAGDSHTNNNSLEYIND